MTTSSRTSTDFGEESTADTMEQPHPLAEAGQEAGQTAGHLVERAADVGIQQADRAREQTAQGLNQLASTVRRVGTDLETEQPMIANIATTAADQAERVAGFLRETDARQLVQTVEDVARRQPLLFVGGAFLLGVAAARFIKAAGGGSTSSNGYRAGRYGAYNVNTGAATGIGSYEAIGQGGTSSGRMGDTTSEGL